MNGIIYIYLRVKTLKYELGYMEYESPFLQG